MQIELGGQQRTLRFGQYSHDLSIERWEERGSPADENPVYACAELIYACLVYDYREKEKNVDFDIDDVQIWQGFPTAASGDPWYDPPYAPH